MKWPTLWCYEMTNIAISLSCFELNGSWLDLLRRIWHWGSYMWSSYKSSIMWLSSCNHVISLSQIQFRHIRIDPIHNRYDEHPKAIPDYISMTSTMSNYKYPHGLLFFMYIIRQVHIWIEDILQVIYMLQEAVSKTMEPKEQNLSFLETFRLT